jgi:hypothetical protein
MKLFRYRRPPLKTLLGITRTKMRIEKELGGTEVAVPGPNNVNRRLRRKTGYEWEAGRVLDGDR